MRSSSTIFELLASSMPYEGKGKPGRSASSRRARDSYWDKGDPPTRRFDQSSNIVRIAGRDTVTTARYEHDSIPILAKAYIAPHTQTWGPNPTMGNTVSPLRMPIEYSARALAHSQYSRSTWV